MITTRPSSCGASAGGPVAQPAWAGRTSSSPLTSVTQRMAASISSVPLTAAMARLSFSDVTVATWPHSAAPIALAPMIAIW
ncbi:hypothetical protein FQZ97_742040 [compost metagenome]